jgi:hypothetical protein
VGIGREPWTTLDLQALVEAPVVATDLDPDRVGNARAHGVDARVGDLAVGVSERAILVRAMNVLRGQGTRPDAHAILAAPLVEDGLLLEGTSDAGGAVVTAWVIQGERRRLLFLTDFTRGFAPGLFWDHLPRDLRRDARPGTLVRDLLDRWTAAFATRPAGMPPADAFRASARGIAGPADVVGERSFEVCWPPEGNASGPR